MEVAFDELTFVDNPWVHLEFAIAMKPTLFILALVSIA